MSDVEEPPNKQAKTEYFEGEVTEEVLDEGHEEWLSEELTDEDFHAANSSNITNGDNKMEDHNDTVEHLDTDAEREIKQDHERNIEEMLHTLDGSKDGISEELTTFLIRKPDKKTDGVSSKELAKQQDDGNDTDDLLRMLSGDVNRTKKKLTKTKSLKPKDIKPEESTDEEEYAYQNSKLTSNPAEPVESDTDDSDASSDEIDTMKKMFEVKKHNVASKSTARSSLGALQRKVVKRARDDNKLQQITPKTAGIKQYVNKNQPVKAGLKYTPANKPTVKQAQKPTTASAEEKTATPTGINKLDIKTPVPFKNVEKFSKSPGLKGKIRETKKGVTDEMHPEEEFLDEDEFGMDMEEYEEMDSPKKQPIMRPERMDEEVPLDGDSYSEDGSLYDECPSSDSDDLDDWFTVDLRAETAGEYIPLLGNKAREILLEERSRVEEQLATLRDSLSALTDSGRKQAEQLRDATMSLAELDDMLKAT